MSELIESSCKRPRIRRKPTTSGLAMPVEITGFHVGQLFRLTDDSMAPDYEEGDVIVCSRVQGIRNIESGSLVIISFGQQNFVKSFLVVDGHFLLVSDNKNYPVLKVEENEINRIWKVEKKLRLSDLEKEAKEYAKINYLDQELDRLSA